MILLINSNLYSRLTLNQNDKIRNLQARNGLILGEGKLVTDGVNNWRAFQSNKFELSYIEDLATALFMIDNNESIIINFEKQSINQYRVANTLPISNQPKSSDISEINLAIQGQNINLLDIIKVVVDDVDYSDVEETLDNFVKERALQVKREESNLWLEGILENGFTYNIAGTNYLIPCKDKDTDEYDKIIELYELNNVPDVFSTFIRGFNLTTNRYELVSIDYATFKMIIMMMGVYVQNMKGQRMANMDIMSQFDNLTDISNYEFRILS